MKHAHEIFDRMERVSTNEEVTMFLELPDIPGVTDNSPIQVLENNYLRIETEINAMIKSYNAECKTRSARKLDREQSLNRLVNNQHLIFGRVSTDWLKLTKKKKLRFIYAEGPWGMTMPYCESYEKRRSSSFASLWVIKTDMYRHQLESPSGSSPQESGQSSSEVSQPSTSAGAQPTMGFLEYVVKMLNVMQDLNFGILSFWGPKSQGHDLAFHIRDKGEQGFFLDPNFGEFRFTKAEFAQFAEVLSRVWSIYKAKKYDTFAWTQIGRR